MYVHVRHSNDIRNDIARTMAACDKHEAYVEALRQLMAEGHAVGATLEQAEMACFFAHQELKGLEYQLRAAERREWA